MTRRDISDYNFSQEEMDRMMLVDGITNHERVKERIKEYAINNGVDPVKPFVLVVCKDTAHAEQVRTFISSRDFFDGKYASKTIILHSNQKGSEKDENVQLLLDVEKYNNPIEIVIHVNILKEGWDVNNLYTIIPLRTAASQTLREQTIGRGLRLPYGQRTGNKDVDSLIITAHDKFEEIIKAAADPHSILKQGNIIFAEDLEKGESIVVNPTYQSAVQVSLEELGAFIQTDENLSTEERSTIVKAAEKASKKLIESYRVVGRENLPQNSTSALVEQVVADEDIAEIVKRRTDFSDIIKRFVGEEIDKQREIIESGTMSIPQIKIARDNRAIYYFEHFTLDTTEFNYYPIPNEILLKNLVDSGEVEAVKGNDLNFDALNPMRVIVDEISKRPEIDYDACCDLLYDLITSLFDAFAKKFSSNEIKNIVMCNKRSIADKIYEQMIKHFKCAEPNIIEEISGVSLYIYEPSYMHKIGEEPISIYTIIPDGDVPKCLFSGFKKALHPIYKFDSAPEKRFAIVCEQSSEVLKWLRPAPKQFNLFYGNGQRYEPDFVVETSDTMYLVEIKGEDKFNDENNLLKKQCAVKYCQVASVYASGHELKKWKYLYIPSQQVQINSSFSMLSQKFEVKGDKLE